MQKKQKEEFFSFNGSVQFQNQIYMIENSRSLIFFFDMDSNEKNMIHAEGYLFDNLFPGQLEDKIYFFPVTIVNRNENLLSYDIKSGCFTEDKYPIKDLLLGEVCITNIFGNEIWILANKQRKIYQINCELEVESELSILNFNEDGKTIYVSGASFADRFFLNGHKGTPLLQGKDGEIQLLDVGKDKMLLEVYIAMVDKKDECKNRSMELMAGKLIYEKLK